MSLTPTQLEELQSITVQLQEEFPSNQDFLWNAAIRIQNVGLGPDGVGGQPAFDALVADMVLTQEQVQKYQGRSGSDDSGFDVSVLSVIPAASTFPIGNVGEILYLEIPPNSYSATDQILIDPAGPNSVQIDEVGTTVFRTVPAASGGVEVNNLSTGAGFERVLTASDLGGGVNSVTGGVNINLTGTGVDPVVNLDAAITGVSVDGVTLNAVGPATNYLDESGNYSVPVGAGGGGAAGTISYIYDNNTGGTDPGSTFFRTSTGNPASVTQFRFSDDDIDSVDVQNIIGNMVVGGYFIMRKADDNTQYRVYAITSIVDNAGWYTINVNYLNAQSSGDNPIPNGAEILFEFFVSAMLAPTVAAGNQRPFAVWDASDTRYEGSGTLISSNPNSPPLGGRLQLGTTSGASITAPQILRPLGAADTYMDVVYGSDPNNAFYQSYFRVAGEMHFGANIASSITNLLTFDLLANVRIQSAAAFRIGEKGAAAADLATYGQLWVNSADDSLNYQTEAGVNFDLTASGGVPGGLTTEVQYNDAGAFQGSDGFVWDEANRRLILDRTGGAGAAIKVNDLLSNTPALEIGGAGSASTNHIIWKSFDQSGTTFWQMFDDHSLSSGNHKLEIQGSTTGNTPYIEFDQSGEMSLFGQQTLEAILFTGLTGTKKVKFQIPLYMEERASADADVLTEGQWWVRNDNPNVPMFTDDLGTDFVLNAGLTQPITLTADIDGDGFNIDDLGVIFMREQASADADVTGQGQIWVLDEGFTQSLMYTNDNGNDFELAALNLTDMNTSALLIPTTSFVECLVFQPDVDRNYMFSASFEVNAPSADDINIELVIDTNAVFKGVLTYSNQAAGISGTFALESAVGDVITNIVTVPTDGSTTPGGTYVVITGCLNMGATSGTHSVRAAKNADTGADGRFEATAALQASVLQVS